MAPEDEAEQTSGQITGQITGPNEFRLSLAASKATVHGCADAVHGGPGSPLEAIAAPIASGGWVCSEADSWTAEMHSRCSGITAAFDDALLLIQQRMAAEPLSVPLGDWRGAQRAGGVSEPW